MSKTTIKISKEIRNKLREFKGFERNYDEAIVELLDLAEREKDE